jgi:hypothetical protein
MRYDLFFTTERVVVVSIYHPADAQQSTSVWKSLLLGDLLSGQSWKLEQRKTSQKKRRRLETMTPDEMLGSNRRNLEVRYNEVASAELTRRFLQHKLEFHLSKGRTVSFNLAKKQVAEAERLLRQTSLSK